jgi:hypothetical protein
MASIMAPHIPMNAPAASAQLWPGILIQAMDITHPPGMAMALDIDPHHQTVTAALRTKSSAHVQ